MGVIYQLDCENCGYQQKLFAGSGRLTIKQTMICTDCAEIVAVPTGLTGKRPPELIQQFAQEFNRCPKCKGVNLKEWPESHPCPKCGQAIDLGHITGAWD